MIKNEKVTKLIVEHFYKQYDLSLIYSVFSNTIANEGMEALSDYVYELSTDKTGPHAERLIKFLNSIGADIASYNKTTFTVDKKINSIEDIVEFIYKTEYEIREEISGIAKEAISTGDFEAYTFLEWFIKDGLKDFGEIDCVKTIFDQNKNLSYVQKDVLIKSYLAK